MTISVKETTSIKLDVKIPNKETQRVIEEVRKGINMEDTSLEEMINERDNIK